MQDTKTRILDAAERRLSERGLAAASLRAITADAGVNLGAVNYHFRSKEGLIQAVFARRLEPLNRARLSALDDCEARAGGRPVPLKELLEAFLDPVLAPGRGGADFTRLMGMMYSEPGIDVQRILPAELGPTVQRFVRAFRRALPDLPDDELSWRLFFSMGAVAQALAAGKMLYFLSEGRCDSNDLVELRARLFRFITAGLTAPGRRGRGRKHPKGRA